MKQKIWVSFDLGVRGDYEGMYAFLDTNDAKECGDSMAYLEFDCKADVFAEFKKAIEDAVTIDRRSRVYLIGTFLNKAKTRVFKGRFIIGGRKAPPWAGYANGESDEEDSGE